MSNSVNCSDIQFPTDVELKILEQIHHLKIGGIFKGV
jgi:hypothetical protein